VEGRCRELSGRFVCWKTYLAGRPVRGGDGVAAGPCIRSMFKSAVRVFRSRRVGCYEDGGQLTQV
jgi:hypothetical protein